MTNVETTSRTVYLFGATSMLGWNIARRRHATSIVPFCNPYIKNDACRSWRRLRIEKESELRALFSKDPPGVLIHCAGICDVEKCENDPDWAWEINVLSAQRLLRFLPDATRLVYCSSDHVFGGSPRAYLESDKPDPVSVYGKTRVEAERTISSAREDALILRAGLPIGPSIDGRTGHLDWLTYRSAQGLPVTLVKDEYRSAVHVEHLVERVLQFAHSDIRGIRHVPATRPVSRVELALHLSDRHGIDINYTAVSRKNRPFPHLGRVELGTEYCDDLAAPLGAAIDSSLA